MKRKRILSLFIAASMLSGLYAPVGAYAEEKPDYSVSADYAARYANGVIEISDAEVSLDEGGEQEIKLIRKGGTSGKVSVEVKAIDVTAKFGEDYTISAENKKFKQDDEYSGTLTENYLEENGTDYITSEEILNDEEYKDIIGYSEPEKLTDEETAELYDASVDMVSKTLGISEDETKELINEQDGETEAETETEYASSLHEFKDSLLGEKTAANSMDSAELLDEDSVLGSNDQNIAAAAVNDAAIGASVIVEFADGENEKTIKIKAKDDNTYEPQETFSLGLCNPEGGAEIGDLFNSGIRINNNDEVEMSHIGFNTDYVQVSADEQAAKVEIVRTDSLNDYALVNVHTVEGTAAEEIDYLPVNASSMFMPGEEKKTVIVPLKTANAVLEENKTLDLVLESDAYSAELTTARATVEIVPAQTGNDSVSLFAAQEEDVPPIVLSYEEARSHYYWDKGNARLFGNIKAGAYDTQMIDRIEVDVTRLRDSSYYYSKKHRVRMTIDNDYRYNNSNSNVIELNSAGSKGTLKLDNLFAYQYNPYFERYFSIEESNGFNIFSSTSWSDYSWSDYSRMRLDDISIDEVRLYPEKFNTILRGESAGTKSGKVTAQYRVFDSTDNAIQTTEYDAGTITLPKYLYRGCRIDAESYSLSSEAKRRGIDFGGYDLTVQYGKHWIREKKRGTEFGLEDFKELNYIYNKHIMMYPIFRGDYINSIHIDEYKADNGALKIGGVTYNNQDAASKSWRVGDELKITAEPAHGYKCDQIRIIRADGTAEYVKPGENVMLSKGMRVYPEFIPQNVTVTLKWAPLGTGIKEDMDENLSDYTLTSDYEFTDNKDGSYTFKNMIPGDVVTLYATPKDPDGEKNHTGLWGRTKLTDDEKSMNDDMRFVLCVGDAFAFEVDDHDMAFSYYFNPKTEQSGGTLVKGQVVTTGGTIKNPNNVKLNAGNIDIAAKPVTNASVSVLSTDPNAVYTKNGTSYYTNAVTDGNGYFTVYLPGGSQNLGYSIAIADSNRLFQKVAVYDRGVTIYELPFQSSNFQIDQMTLGTDTETTEIAVGDTNIILGVHAVIASGYRAQYLKFRSYDEEGMLFREWMAVESSSPDWTYESKFVPSEYLKEGGKLTVELYDANGKGQGEVDTGYSMRTQPVKTSFTLPQFDPQKSVTLPVLGDVTSKFDLGSDSKTEPKDGNEKSKDSLSSGAKSEKHMLEITYGSGKAVKNAVKAAKSDSGYDQKDAQGKALSILGNVSVDSKDQNTVMEKKAETRGGKGKNAMDFSYELGVYMSMYTQGGKYYYEDMTLYASISASAGTTQQFTIAGIPIYLKLSGEASGSMLLRLDTEDGKALEIINPKAKGYFNKDMLDSLQTSGVFNVLIKVNIGAGVGNPKIVSAGLGGTLAMNMDYQPWKDGAGIADFGLNAEFNLIGVSIKYNIAKASYGMFKTDDYSGDMDFSKVKNSDKFKNSNMRLLMSYDDGESVTEVSGSYEKRRRGNSKWEDNHDIELFAANDADNSDDPIIAERTMRNAIDTITPKLVSVSDDKALLFMLQDDTGRGANDCSALVYSTIDTDGNQSDPQYLDTDGTFDSNLAAAKLGDGRILVVWSDATKEYGDEDINLGEALNHTDLSYCIFSADGTPGEVKKLTEQECCESMPTIAYDETTGKTIIAYTATDYQTDGVDIGEENMETLGNFLYNSYSTVCFKVLDQNGDIITDYTPNEAAYLNYESSNGEGSLDGMRFMNVQLTADRSQATIDEMTSAAIDGKVYVFYSLDTDRNTATDEDRELFSVRCDLSTMEQSEPIRLTDNLTADTNPQAVVYENKLQLYWNNDGIISCANPLLITDDNEKLSDGAQTIETMDGAAQTFVVTVQPDGNLCLLWNSWNDGSEEVEGTRAALYYKEYDPDYKVPTGDEQNPYTLGCWGNRQLIDAAENENEDLNEISYIKLDKARMAAYKITHKSDEGAIESYEAYFSVFVDHSSLDLNMAAAPDYPMPGDKVTLNITGINTGSLPAEKATIKAELIKNNDVISEIGTQVIDGHIQTNGTVTAIFENFTMPENPEEYKIRATAFEEGLETYPSTEEFDLPYDTNISVSNMELEQQDTNQYRISLNMKNDGNSNLKNGKVRLEYVADDWNNADAKQSFTPVTGDVPIELGSKQETREYYTFDIPKDQFNQNGVCEIQLSILNKDEKVCAYDTFYVNSAETAEVSAADIYVNGVSEPEAISVKKNDTVPIAAAVMPITARNGYHITYGIDDPAIAEVDASGVVKGLKKGSTKLNIYAYKTENNIFISSNSRATDMDGTPIVIDENGMVTNLTAGSDTEPVLTKTVDINVTGASSNGGGSSSSRSTYVVTFDSQGGSDIASIKVSQNSTITKPADPKKEGYIFDGWYSDKECSSVYYFDTKVTENITLYAKWTEKPTETVTPIETSKPNADWFTDVPENAWYYNSVKYMFEHGLMVGVSDTEFAPEADITRAMFVTTLYRMENKPDVSNEILGYPFADVDADSWYGNAVYWARLNGIVEGYSDEKFAPEENITREQMAAIVYRYAKFKEYDTELSSELVYSDNDSISDYAKDAVIWSLDNGIMLGNEDNTFSPASNTTRAQAAAVFERVVKNLH